MSSKIYTKHKSVFLSLTYKKYSLKIETNKDLKSFFDTHYRNSVISANRILNDQAEAEDVVQNCLIKLWNNRNQLKEATIGGYFATMVRNRSIDILRKKKPVLVELDDVQLPTEDHSQMEHDELKTKIDSAIDSLPDRCREVFVLSRFEKMSHKEIAKSLTITTKTVENQITKALKVISSALIAILFFLFFK